MSDTLPADTGSPAIAALAPARRYTPSLEEQARAAAAAEHLAQVAAGLGVSPEDYAKAGNKATQKHWVRDLDADSACTIRGASRYPYLTLGGQP